MLCLDQVADTRNALTFLAQHPNVDGKRIGVLGSSFGAAVAVYTAGVDERVAACVSTSGWGNGETKFQGQHSGPGEYQRFLDMLKRGREHREKTGKSLMVDRYDIVPIPAHLRGHVVERSIVQFPAETAQSMPQQALGVKDRPPIGSLPCPPRADPPCDRRANFGVAEIEFGSFKRRLHRRDGAARLAQFCRLIVEPRLRRDIALNQFGLAKR